ncbi:hypothetical protein PC123_g28203 [Phytophthora cactorum]|nr:hypothetical protein PC123_g28203 [Phytophthora cactorum]
MAQETFPTLLRTKYNVAASSTRPRFADAVAKRPPGSSSQRPFPHQRSSCSGFLLSHSRLPSTEKELAEVMQGFEEMLGFPGVVGAIDGTLITIKRFEDFEGFYCRKGFPAFNLMAVVDNELRFIAFSIRNGVQNDQSVLNRSLASGSNLLQTSQIPHTT